MSSEAGFTLLEVMIALVIAALACIVLYEAGFPAVGEDVTAARYQEALARAQSHLAALGTLTRLRTGQLSGDDGGGFHWGIRIAAEPGMGSLTLYDVQVTERFGGRAVTLTSKRLGPGA